MKNSFLGELKDKIEKNLYTISDIMNCEFRLEAIKNKDNASEKSFLKKDIMPGIKNVLSAGELPALNTDFENYSKDGIIDDDLLAEYIDRIAYYVHRDLDISKTHVTVSVPLKIIFLNLKSLSDDQLNKIKSKNPPNK